MQTVASVDMHFKTKNRIPEKLVSELYKNLGSGEKKSPHVSEFKNRMVRTSPSNLARFTADFRNTLPKTSSVSSSQSDLRIASKSGCGSNAGSLWRLANRFQGQTS